MRLRIAIIRSGITARWRLPLTWIFQFFKHAMQPAIGPSAPRETRELISPFDISEIVKQLHDATVTWSGSGPVEVELRGPSNNIILFFTPMNAGGSKSLLVQARLVSDRGVALSLEKINLHAIFITAEEQEPIIAKSEAHALTLLNIETGITYVLQVMHPPPVARGTTEVLPEDEVADLLSDSALFEDLVCAGAGRKERPTWKSALQG